MARLALSTIVKAILTVLVIGSLLFFTLTYYQPVQETFLNLPCKWLDLCETKEQMQANQYAKNPQSFDDFTQGYVNCKQSTQSDCRCDITKPYLPPNTFIELNNRNQHTVITLCQGRDECEQTVKEIEVRNDNLNIPPIYTGFFETQGIYSINNNKVESGRGFSPTNVVTLKKHRSDLQVTATTTQLAHKFNYHSIYKKDLSNTYILPKSSVNNVDEVYETLPLCEVTEGTGTGKRSFENVQNAIKQCIEHKIDRDYVSHITVVVFDTGQLEANERAIATFTYKLPEEAKGFWQKNGPYLVTVNEQGVIESNTPLDLLMIPEVMQQVQDIEEELQTKSATEGQRYFDQFTTHELSLEPYWRYQFQSAKEIEVIKEELFNDPHHRTDDHLSINDLEELQEPIEVGVCADVPLQLTGNFRIRYFNNEFRLYDGQRPLEEKMLFPIQLRRANTANAPLEQTQRISEFTFTQDIPQVQFIRYSDGSVAIYPYTLETYLAAAQQRAQEALS